MEILATYILVCYRGSKNSEFYKIALSPCSN